MFKKISDLFRKEPPKPEYRQIEFSKIDRYMNYMLRDSLGAINKTILESTASIDQKKESILASLKEFGKAELMNKNIWQREIQLMEGNRDNYIKKIHHFVSKIDIPKGYLEMYDYCVKFSQRLEQLGKEIQKNMFILHNYFENEVKQINKELQDIEKTIINIRITFERNNIHILKKVQDEIKGIKDNNLKILDIKAQIREEESQKAASEDKSKKLNERIATITSGSDYKALESFKKEKQAAEDAIKQATKEVDAIFSELDTALRKYYYRNPDKKILKEYFDNTTTALINDERLEIVDIVKDMRKLVDQDILDLKDKKKENTLDAADNISLELLKEKQAELKKLEDTRQNSQKKITHNSASLNLSEHQYWLKSTQDKIDSHESQIKRFEADIAKIKEKNESIRQEIQNQLENILKEKVQVIDDLETAGKEEI